MHPLTFVHAILSQFDPNSISWEKISLVGTLGTFVALLLTGKIVPGWAYNDLKIDNERLRRALDWQQRLNDQATGTSEEAVKTNKTTGAKDRA